MNQRSPFENYFTGRADQLDVPGSGAAAIAERARGRRRRRRTASVALVGVAVLAGGALAGPALRSDDSQEIANYGAGIVESPFDWTTVPVREGLGWTVGMARADSGAIYGLSTAPGPNDAARRLYGSVDGTDWEEVALPEGLRPNDVAAEGDTIYAVGTSAVGGSIRVQVASTTAPDDGWAVTELPLDLGAEGAGVPGRVFVSETATATLDGRTVVAVSLGVEIDAAQVLGDDVEVDQWYAMPHGMVRQPVLCTDESGEPASTTSAPATAPATAPADGASGDDPLDGADCVDEADAVGSETVQTWSELGYGEDVGHLIQGVTHVYSADDTGSFQLATTATQPMGGLRGLEVSPEGFWLFTPVWTQGDRIVVHHSADGLDWSGAPSEVAGASLATGVIGGRAAVVTSEWNPTTNGTRVSLHQLTVAGVESLDLTDMASTGDGAVYPSAAGIGPLGVAVVAGSAGGSSVVLHSTDGTGFSRTAVPAAPDGYRQVVNGLTMTADAVKVRLNLYLTDDLSGTEPAEQRLLVGTPR